MATRESQYIEQQINETEQELRILRSEREWSESVICSYCLKREAVVSRRCQPCQDYLDRLHASDRQADRDYGAGMVIRAALNYAARERGGIRRQRSGRRDLQHGG